jgi:hypothetical protein
MSVSDVVTTAIPPAAVGAVALAQLTVGTDGVTLVITGLATSACFGLLVIFMRGLVLSGSMFGAGAKALEEIIERQRGEIEQLNVRVDELERQRRDDLEQRDAHDRAIAGLVTRLVGALNGVASKVDPDMAPFQIRTDDIGYLTSGAVESELAEWEAGHL